MKRFPLAIAAWLIGTALAGAQEPARTPLVRGDVHFVIGWQNLHKEQATQQGCCSNDWLNTIFYGAAGAGWY